MKTYTTRDEMEPKLVQTLTQMMESHAYRELAAAQMFGHGLQFVPRLKWLRFLLWHAKEEMDHYALVVGMYQKFTGESVEPKVNARLSTRPIGFPGSWFELAARGCSRSAGRERRAIVTPSRMASSSATRAK